MATFTVTNTNDSGAGSLRQAIADAEEVNSAGAETIEFAPWLDGSTIFLSSTLEITSGTLSIDGDLDGDGDADIIISGDTDESGTGNAGDVGTVISVGAGADATFQSLQISDGYHRGAAATSFGGTGEEGRAGIVNNGDLTIINSIISGNEAFGGNDGGSETNSLRGADAIAGIVNTATGSLTITDSVFSDNEATGATAADGDNSVGRGGNGTSGIQSSGALQVDGVVMNNGTATGGNGGYGGFVSGGRGGHAIVGIDQRGGTMDGIVFVGNDTTTLGPGGLSDFSSAGPDGSTYAVYTSGGTGSITSSALTGGEIGTLGADSKTVAFGERFFGLGGDDIIDNSAGSGILYGGSGDDQITTQGISGKVYGGSGDDIITNTWTDINMKMDGGSGNDLLDVSQVSGFDFTLNMKTGVASSSTAYSSAAFTASNFENVIGMDDASMSDNITGTNGKNIISGLAGNDTLKGGGGNDVLDGGANNDTLKGGNGKDTLGGGSGKDLLKGNKGNDQLFGGSGKDNLQGGDGKDVLKGGSGNDKLSGGKQNDTLYGGGGKDKFVFAKDFGKDRIKDFSDNTDTLLLDDNLWSGTLSKNQILSQFASINGQGQAVFDFGNGDILKIDGVANLSDLKNDMTII